ncbi:MAG TPA: PIN domain-containing protein [Acidobacteriaceae bacterium]|nr:PIN domain-containing protein [Acidobacteriaceae bacterium]
MTYVLDSSALLRFLEGDTGGRSRKAGAVESTSRHSRAAISSVNWGEVIGVIAKRQGEVAANSLLTDLAPYKLEIVPVNAEHAHHAAYIKLNLKIPYADSFAVELASAPDHILLTADFDFKPAAQTVTLEFLPAKSKG